MEDCESEIVYVRGCKVVGVWICGDEEVEEDCRTPILVCRTPVL